MRDTVDTNMKEELERDYAHERQLSAERIMRVTAEHEEVLRLRMRQLGVF
jgi:hypothetical protein